LAGGRKNEVFMGTDTQEGQISHQIFQSTDGGNTCSATGVPDGGTLPNGTDYAGDGKLAYDEDWGGRVIEPVVFSKNSKTVGVGAATWNRSLASFSKPVMAARTSLFAHWPAIAVDSADNVYMVWDTDPRAPGTHGGCNGANTELPNAIKMSVSRNFGKTWSKPITVAKPAGERVYWPWIAAGKSGRVSVVWYQTNKVVDLDCTAAKTSVYEASLFRATKRHPTAQIVNAAGRPIHTNFVCQGGTSCVATGQDRRLGDYFTNAIDPRGCVVIATGDTTVKGPGGTERPTSLPIFLRQSSGPGLLGKRCGP